MQRKIPDDAFDYYVGLGVNRSYEKVAAKYGTSKRGVVKHASREGWSQRLAKIERDAREKGDQKLTETLGEMRNRHLTTLRAMNARVINALREYPLSTGMEAMKSAELVIKLERLIVGEASERTELSVEEVTKREIGRWLEPPNNSNADQND